MEKERTSGKGSGGSLSRLPGLIPIEQHFTSGRGHKTKKPPKQTTSGRSLAWKTGIAKEKDGDLGGRQLDADPSSETYAEYRILCYLLELFNCSQTFDVSVPKKTWWSAIEGALLYVV